jgi:hypothetical protein
VASVERSLAHHAPTRRSFVTSVSAARLRSVSVEHLDWRKHASERCEHLRERDKQAHPDRDKSNLSDRVSVRRKLRA